MTDYEVLKAMIERVRARESEKNFWDRYWDSVEFGDELKEIKVSDHLAIYFDDDGLLGGYGIYE